MVCTISDLLHNCYAFPLISLHFYFGMLVFTKSKETPSIHFNFQTGRKHTAWNRYNPGNKKLVNNYSKGFGGVFGNLNRLYDTEIHHLYR